MTYEQASKLPKGGAVAMGPPHMLATACKMIASRQGLQPKALYDWAKRFNVDLTSHWYKFADIEANAALLSDILNDRFHATKYLTV